MFRIGNLAENFLDENTGQQGVSQERCFVEVVEVSFQLTNRREHY
jgi:hypothetical protein